MNNPSWRGIRAFIFVAEHGSFTAAADASGFSKANLSQLVTDLESALHVQLLHRTTRQLRLTDVGQGYYERCKHAMVMLDCAAQWATESTDGLQGTIRMNAVGGLLGDELLAPLVLRFQQQHPDIEIHLDFSSIRVDLIEKQYDLVFRMGKLPDSSLIAKTLGSVTTRYVASPAFLKKYGQICQPEDLKTLPLIYGSVDHWVMNRGKRQEVIHVERGMKLVSGRVMRQAALAGLGVTRLADVYCQSDIRRGSLVEILPQWSEQTPVALVCPPVRHQLGRVRALMNWIAEHFETGYQQLLNSGPAADKR